jgi:hypothetical protein
VTALENLANVIDAPTFKVLSVITMFVVLILWIANAVMSLVGIFRGTIFGLNGGWKGTNLPLLRENSETQSE